jgi:hypothetical protein
VTASLTLTNILLNAIRPKAAALAFNVRAFSPDGDVQPDRLGPGFRTRKKCSAASLHWVSICTTARELTWNNWIIWMAPELICHPLPFVPSRALKANPVRT